MSALGSEADVLISSVDSQPQTAKAPQYICHDLHYQGQIALDSRQQSHETAHRRYRSPPEIRS